MADLIDRAKAIKAIEDMQDCYNGFSSTFDKAQIIEVLEEVPTAERRGHWVRVGKEFGFAFDNFYCSECNYFSGTKTTNYCPNCGADMRERSDNGQND